MFRKVYFCRKCGATKMSVKKPKVCWNCPNKTFGRLLTGEDLNKLKI